MQALSSTHLVTLKTFLTLIFVFFETQTFAQEKVTLSYQNKDWILNLTPSSIDSVKLILLKAEEEKNSYQIAWSLGTISILNVLLKNSVDAYNFQAQAIGKIKELNPDQLISCVIEINSPIMERYAEQKIPNGFNLDIPINFGDQAIEALSNTKKVNIVSAGIYFLLNNAVLAWKYDFNQAYYYFEKVKMFSTPILIRSILNPNQENLEMVKDPLRRYVRFMYNSHFSKNTSTINLCQKVDCLEKAWQVTQLLKSRTFKSQIISQKIQGLSLIDKTTILEGISFIDSAYNTDTFYRQLLNNSFKYSFPLEKRIDSIFNIITSKLPEFDLLIRDPLSITQLQKQLKSNEIYISLMYTDNERHVYAWRIQSDKEPQLLKLDLKTLDLFFRVEFFKNTTINRPSYVNIFKGDTIFKIDLIKYASYYHQIEIDDLTNSEILYNKVIKPLNLGLYEKIILEIDQNLGSFPLGLLKNPLTKKMLIENYQIIYTPSASVFYYLRNKQISGASNLDYFGFGYNENPKSFVDSAILSSARVFGNKTKYILQSSESNIYENEEEIYNAKILHFACHNDISEKMFRLKFGSDTLNDGSITEIEIVNHLQNNAALVVLTSCMTAPYLDEYDFITMEKIGYIGEDCVCSIGETFSNITSSFFAAGAGKMLVTQWEIPDSKISSLFISELLSYIAEGMACESALKATQENFRLKYDIQYWGGYILVGE